MKSLESSRNRHNFTAKVDHDAARRLEEKVISEKKRGDRSYSTERIADLDLRKKIAKDELLRRLKTKTNKVTVAIREDLPFVDDDISVITNASDSNKMQDPELVHDRIDEENDYDESLLDHYDTYEDFKLRKKKHEDMVSLHQHLYNEVEYQPKTTMMNLASRYTSAVNASSIPPNYSHNFHAALLEDQNMKMSPEKNGSTAFMYVSDLSEAALREGHVPPPSLKKTSSALQLIENVITSITMPKEKPPNVMLPPGKGALTAEEVFPDLVRDPTLFDSRSQEEYRVLASLQVDAQAKAAIATPALYQTKRPPQLHVHDSRVDPVSEIVDKDPHGIESVQRNLFGSTGGIPSSHGVPPYNNDNINHQSSINSPAAKLNLRIDTSKTIPSTPLSSSSSFSSSLARPSPIHALSNPYAVNSNTAANNSIPATSSSFYAQALATPSKRFVDILRQRVEESQESQRQQQENMKMMKKKKSKEDAEKQVLLSTSKGEKEKMSFHARQGEIAEIRDGEYGNGSGSGSVSGGMSGLLKEEEEDDDERSVLSKASLEMLRKEYDQCRPEKKRGSQMKDSSQDIRGVWIQRRDLFEDANSNVSPKDQESKDTKEEKKKRSSNNDDVENDENDEDHPNKSTSLAQSLSDSVSSFFHLPSLHLSSHRSTSSIREFMSLADYKKLLHRSFVSSRPNSAIKQLNSSANTMASPTSKVAPTTSASFMQFWGNNNSKNSTDDAVTTATNNNTNTTTPLNNNNAKNNTNPSDSKMMKVVDLEQSPSLGASATYSKPSNQQSLTESAVNGISAKNSTVRKDPLEALYEVNPVYRKPWKSRSTQNVLPFSVPPPAHPELNEEEKDANTGKNSTSNNNIHSLSDANKSLEVTPDLQSRGWRTAVHQHHYYRDQQLQQENEKASSSSSSLAALTSFLPKTGDFIKQKVKSWSASLSPMLSSSISGNEAELEGQNQEGNSIEENGKASYQASNQGNKNRSQSYDDVASVDEDIPSSLRSRPPSLARLNYSGSTLPSPSAASGASSPSSSSYSMSASLPYRSFTPFTPVIREEEGEEEDDGNGLEENGSSAQKRRRERDEAMALDQLRDYYRRSNSSLSSTHASTASRRDVLDQSRSQRHFQSLQSHESGQSAPVLHVTPSANTMSFNSTCSTLPTLASSATRRPLRNGRKSSHRTKDSTHQQRQSHSHSRHQAEEEGEEVEDDETEYDEDVCQISFEGSLDKYLTLSTPHRHPPDDYRGSPTAFFPNSPSNSMDFSHQDGKMSFDSPMKSISFSNDPHFPQTSIANLQAKEFRHQNPNLRLAGSNYEDHVTNETLLDLPQNVARLSASFHQDSQLLQSVSKQQSIARKESARHTLWKQLQRRYQEDPEGEYVLEQKMEDHVASGQVESEDLLSLYSQEVDSWNVH